MTSKKDNTGSELLYQTLVENMNEAVWMADPNERTLYANPKFCSMLGYTSDEIIGKEAYFLWDDESIKKVKYNNENFRKKGLNSTYQAVLVPKLGDGIPVLVHGAALPNGNTIGMMTDLREIKKKDSQYKQIVDNMSEALWMGDARECTVYANPRFCAMLEYDLNDIIGIPSYQFWDEESAKRVKYINVHHRKKGITSSYEGNLLSKSGRKIPVLANGTPMPDGGTMAILTDITELKQRQETEKMLHSAIRYASDAIIFLDKAGKILSWNKGAKVIFGYRQEEIVGMGIDRLLPTLQIEEYHESSIGRTYTDKFEGQHKNKDSFAIATTITPIFAEDRMTITHFLLIGRDISKESRFEEELAMRYQKMKEAYNQFGIMRRQMDYIFDLLDAARSLDKKALADFIVSSIVMLSHVDACILRIYNEKKNTLEMVSCFGVGNEWYGKSTIKYEKSLVQKAYQKQTVLRIIDVTKDPYYQTPHLARQNNLSSLMVIPLQWKGKLVGSLGLYVSPEKKLEIFDNDFIQRYAKIIEMVLGKCI